MEQAVFISKTEGLKHFLPSQSRLYFGNEFCQRLVPSLDELKTCVDFVSLRNAAFTFVTPFVTDEGLAGFRKLFKYLSALDFPVEVVVNDWGMLRLVSSEFSSLTPVLGRLLTKQKRGPRINFLKGHVPEGMYEHFQGCAVDSAEVLAFLRRLGVTRIELDNLLQGIRRFSDALPASLYFPYVYVTTTRYCLSAGCALRDKPFSRSIGECGKECREYEFSLKNKRMPVELLLRGNTQFFMNSILPYDLSGLGIDRLVFEPEIPM